jgi:hypothetical protein
MTPSDEAFTHHLCRVLLFNSFIAKKINFVVITPMNLAENASVI